eukprot:TRINITY_DN29211_c0_g1_i1.p1 TRINITY_DN29211_c0_g1~~TRINITY_DN29211_c0_g1_i1.p1  ORF type:complete len:582 (-),score=109.08 TRINITY_DN29211_c0_g1_i1:177-1922(-)
MPMMNVPLREGTTAGNEDARGGAANAAAQPSTSDDSSEVCDITQHLLELGVNMVLSAVFWTFVWYYWATWEQYLVWALVVAAATAWRIRQRKAQAASALSASLPYTCGYAEVDGKELYVVGTLHISPRAPRDVSAVIGIVQPSVVMIELDDERLEDIEGAPPAEIQLQAVEVHEIEDINGSSTGASFSSGNDPAARRTIMAQRAFWNAERSGDIITGRLVYDNANPYGVSRQAAVGSQLSGNIALVHRGGPDASVATFLAKAHNAARAGAAGVFVINDSDTLPNYRVGSGTMSGDMKVAWQTRSCAFPSIPLLVLPQTEGERLRSVCSGSSSTVVHSRFEVLQDDYPRSTVRRRLCQACVLIFSGVGVLYGVIDCCSVDVGTEFTTAKSEAEMRNIPCKCIDVDMNTLCSRLGRTVLPTPCNIGHAAAAWLAFPRVLFASVFPPRGRLDVLGGTLLHIASLPLKTWLAFVCAGLAAGCIAGFLLIGVSSGAASAGSSAGVVPKGTNTDEVTSWIILALELYLIPRLYEAMAATRDEAMYRGIVENARSASPNPATGACRMVVVVGAAHANGILHRVRTRGL